MYVMSNKGVRMDGEKIQVKDFHKENKKETEFIDSGNDAPSVPETLSRCRKKRLHPVDKLTREQLNNACDKIIMGTPVSEVAEQMGVNAQALSRRVKEQMGCLYMRRWQQSIAYDSLRAERILRTAMDRLDESPKWCKVALEVLSYRSRVLGFEHQQMEEATIRVAGMSQAEIFAEIKKRL